MRLPQSLTDWFDLNQRPLPWRTEYNPYHVWVSEIMLQQTRVEAVLPYFANWLSLFPDLKTLANASEAKVLKAWEGLGYYSRARNLHAGAKELMATTGRIPSEVTELLKIKGIGPYTAGAISSIAFNQAEPLLDGNVKRVFSRLLDWEKDVQIKESERRFLQFGKELLKGFEPRTINQGLMELGALVCTPKSPKCGVCPWVAECLSFANKTLELRPVKLKKQKIIKETRLFFVYERKGKYYLEQQPDKGRWAKMYLFPNELLDVEPKEIKEVAQETSGGRHLCDFKYSVTCYQVTATAYLVPAPNDVKESETGAWLSLEELETETLPKPAVEIRNSLQRKQHDQ